MNVNEVKKQRKQDLSSLTEEIESSIEFEIEEVKYVISDLIYQLMEERQMTRAGLAEIMQRSRAFITKILSGSNNFEVSTLVHIARSLGYKLNVEGLFVPRSSSPKSASARLNPWEYRERRILRLVHPPVDEQSQKPQDNEPEGKEILAETDALLSLVA